MRELFHRLLEFFIAHGYWGVFFGVMLENAGLPVPGETIVLLAGFGAYQGHFSLPVVMAVAAVGAILGDNAGYAIGRRVGRGTLMRYGKYILLTPPRLRLFDRFFEKYGDKTILVARFITGLRVFAALLAGAANMPWGRFFIFNMLGAVIWSVVIALVGYFFSKSWEVLEGILGRAGLVLLVAGIVALVVVVKRRRASEEVEEPVEEPALRP